MNETTHPGASVDQLTAHLVVGMGAFGVIGLISPMAAGPGIEPAEAGSVLTIYALASALSLPLGAALADWGSMISVLFTASYLGADYVLYTYLAPRLQNVQGFGRDGMTLVQLISGSGAVVGSPVSGQLDYRFGARRTLTIVWLSQALLLPLFALLALARLWLGERLVSSCGGDLRTVRA